MIGNEVGSLPQLSSLMRFLVPFESYGTQIKLHSCGIENVVLWGLAIIRPGRETFGNAN